MKDTFSMASATWSSFAPFRSERERSKRYVYGDQWGDYVPYREGKIKEGSLYSEMGQAPLTNNILRRILRNIVGLYRSQYKVPQLSAKDSGLRGKELREANAAIRRWFRENSMEELAPRLLEEFLISGMAAVKVEEGCILPVTPDNFFFHNDGYDPRGYDIDLIGEEHRVGFGTILEKFCETAEDYRMIAEVFKPEKRGAGGCRLIEVWRRETRIYSLLHDENAATLQISPTDIPTSKDHQNSKFITRNVWHRFWYAFDGTLLREDGDFDRHPYIIKAYPFIDGEIHSYISDLIDQQRYVNRLITLYDFIMRSSAKGVLLFPDESIPAGMDLQGVAEEWSRFNGVIPYKAKPGVPMPKQVSANSTNIGITELLKIEMQMLEDISGVAPTLQGKLQTNSTSGTLFAQQNEAAQTSLLDILHSFTDFLRQLMERRMHGRLP